MAAEDFFSRWAKVKKAPEALTASGSGAAEAEALPDSIAAQPTKPPPAPTMEDVASLTGDSDYSQFMARGVDPAVRRGAMKKLFADPHYNIMDGLDIYIGNYNTFEPIPVAMLALLDHAKGVLDPLSMFEKPVMQMTSLLQPAPVVEPEPEPEPDPEMASDPEAESDIEPEIGPEPQIESEPEIESEPALDVADAPEQSLAPVPASPEQQAKPAVGIDHPPPQSRTW
jgi:hypothetical protein